MANKKYVTNIDIDGNITANGVIETGGGNATTLFLTNGTKSEVDSWKTNEW